MIQKASTFSRNATDLVIVVVLTIISGLAALLPATPPWLLPLLAIPLVIALPGYALTAALFPKGSLETAEILACSLALSLAVDVLGGLAVNLIPQGFSTLTWITLLGSVSIVGSIVAAIRWQGRLLVRDPLRIGVTPGQMFMLGASVVMVVSAFLYARTWADEPMPSFTQLWILPKDSNLPNSYELGVKNLEFGRMAYIVEIRANNHFLGESLVSLLPGETWTQTVLSSGTPMPDLQAFLYRANDPTHIYRSVEIRGNSK